jgi:hypothetical protein
MRAIVVAGLTGIAPRDEMEGMIAAQMIACHDTIRRLGASGII